MLPLYIPILILISNLLIFITKENKNYFKLKISIFLFGFFTIIFSETTIRFISGVFNENIKIIVLPILLVMIFYYTLSHKLTSEFKK